jgi:2-hydroxychromene-2-carboxylate isomerase
MALDFWFDVVCPYAYLASTRVQALADEAGVPVRWRPVLLGGLLREHGANPDPNQATAPARKAVSDRDLARRAAELGVPLRFPANHPRRTVEAMRLVVSAPADVVPALAAALFRAYWVDGEDVSDPAVLERVGARFGVARTEAARDVLRANTAEAAAAGVFGVPTFRVGDDLQWGVDRLPLVREALGLREPAWPRPTGGVVRFFHDVASPFSYLASTRIAEVAGDARVEWTPILVGALFKAVGTPLVPLETFSRAKNAWYRRDLERWAARYQVPFRFPTEFPIRSLAAQRVLVAEPDAAAALYRAAWADDRPISDPAVVREVLDAAGFDGGALLARAEAPEVKDRLRRNTEDAVAAGACGVPSFVVGRELFWGQDRLDQVARALTSGSTPSAP